MPDKKREIVSYLIDEWKLSVRQACDLINFNRSSYYYKIKIDYLELESILNELRFQGFTKIEIQEILENEKSLNKNFKKEILSYF